MMKFKILKKCALPLAAVFLSISQNAIAESAIIVNNSVTNGDISAKELRRIFLGKKTTWDDGTSVQPCYINTIDDSGVNFFKTIIRKDHTKFKRYWVKKLFSGDGVAPAAFESLTEVSDYVSKRKGAICYVNDSSQLDSNTARKISVDGNISL